MVEEDVDKLRTDIADIEVNMDRIRVGILEQEEQNNAELRTVQAL